MRRTLLLTLLIAALVFAGTVTAMAEKVEISFWYAVGGNSGRVFGEMVEEFNRTSTDVCVNAVYTGSYGETAQKVTASIAADTLPDGGLIPATPLFTGHMGNFIIQEYIDGPDGLDMDDFYPELWEYSMYKGEVASLPFNHSTPVMFYNKDLLREAGVEPVAPNTWDELKTALIAVRDWAKETGRRQVWPINMRNEDWMLKAFILQNGGQLVNGDYSRALINEPLAVEAIEFWMSLIDEGLMPAGAHNRAREQFIAGDLAFLYDTTAGVGTIASTVEFDAATAFLPGNVKRAVTLGGAGLAMFPSTPERQEATWKFLKWLLLPENCIKWSVETGYVPIRKSVLESERIQQLFEEKPMYRAGFEQLEFLEPLEQFWELGAFDEYMRDLISNIEFKAMTPQEAADKFIKDMQIEFERN